MNMLRTLSGLVALVLLAVGLNLLVFKQDVFRPLVFVPLGIGILCALLWLVLSLMALAGYSAQGGRTLYGLTSVLTSVVFLGICIVIYAFAQHWNAAWDLTQEGRRKLSEQTIQVLRNMNKEVGVICFFLQTDDELVRIAEDKTRRFLDQCARHTSNLAIEFLDPQIERARLEALKITHASTQGTVVLRCGTRQKVILLSGASPRLEERDFTNSLINVLREAKPKVCFLTGHGERSIDDPHEKNGASLLKQLLEGEAYEAERIGIAISHAEVPADCDILVINGLGIGGVQSDLHPEEIRAIQAFLDQGGRLLVLLDPWRKMAAGQNQIEQLRPWLEHRFGIVVGEDMAVSPSSRWTVEFTPDTAAFGSEEAQSAFRGSFNMTHRVARSFDQKLIFSAARTVGLAQPLPDKAAGTELLRTTPDFYAETDLALLLSEGKAVKSPEERSGPLPMGVAVTAKTDFLVGDSGQTRDARIVVFGDSEFISNSQLTVIPGNLNLILNALAWLSESEELIAIRPSGKEDPPVLLTEPDRQAIVWISVLGAVQAVVVAGLAVYLWRRKYQ